MRHRLAIRHPQSALESARYGPAAPTFRWHPSRGSSRPLNFRPPIHELSKEDISL